MVLGKGDKERIVYFDARTKIHLQNYLNSRTDNNPALFVSLKAPYERLKNGGIEVRLRNFGKQLGISKVHPHKFRRTLATMAIATIYNDLFYYNREMYREFCCCTKEVQNRILEYCDLDLRVSECNIYEKCLTAIESVVNKYFLMIKVFFMMEESILIVV